MRRYAKEVGPIPRPRDSQRRNIELVPCLCEECRAAMPLRQALWEAKQRATKKAVEDEWLP